MSGSIWLPGLLVLAAGLAIGLTVALKLRGHRPRPARKRDDPELRLKIRDLERRRDELYARLRASELTAGDRLALEDAAARTLRDLDRLGAGRRPPEPAAAAPAPAALPAGARPGLAGRHPLLTGFLFGASLVVLVGVLVYWAVRDAGPRPGTAPPTATDEPHDSVEGLPAAVQQELARLEAAVAAAPNDLLAFKRLALGRLDAGLYFQAFEDANAILAAVPEDPDALFIQGVVRLTMGQYDDAIEALDRVLARFPEHLQAMIYRGLALAQSGRLDQAVDTWEIGLEMAGGRHPEIEQLLETARAQPPAAAAAAPVTPRTAPEPAGPAYRVTISLAPDAQAGPGAVLFVFLRPGESGPPVAVARIASPRFPARVVLDSDSAMMEGAELPREGILVARLDADGSASTQGAGDLEASLPAVIDQPLEMMLGTDGQP